MTRLSIIALSAAVYLLARRVLSVERDIVDTNQVLADHVDDVARLMAANTALVRTVTRLIVPAPVVPSEHTKRSANC